MKRTAAYCIMAVLCAAPEARADIDHRCLQQCTDNGANATSCLSQCVYGDAVSTRAIENKHVLHSHHVVATPIPLSADVIVPAHKALPTSEAPKNYACFNQCLQRGMAYGLCDKACAQPACSTATSVCHDVTRIVNGAQPDDNMSAFMKNGSASTTLNVNGTK